MNQPEKAEISHGVPELCGIHGLAHVTVTAVLVRFKHLFLLVRGRQNDDGEASCAGIGAQALQDLKSVNFRQIQVQQDQGGHCA